VFFLDFYLYRTYQHTNTPGCAVGVDAPGLDTWTAAYGMADLEHAVANMPATVFEVGSVSKQFTAAAVLLLVDRGQVSLDDNIHRYFPEIPTYERPITVRQLLNHTSGLRDWGEVESFAGWPRTTREYTHAHVLEIISRQHVLNYPPGDAWSYTNSGYNLAAMLVERISGMTLQAFCLKEFFEPLGMTSTQWRDDFRRIVPNRAIAYSMHGSEWRQDMPFEDIYGNGGLLTTVGDLLKWNSNLATGKLHPSVFELMQKPGSLSNGHSINYGFGLFLLNFETLAEVSHSGATAGYRAWLGRIPAKGVSVAVLCNAGSANPTDYDGLLDLFVVNGHVYPGVDKQDWGTTWAQRPLLMRNLDGVKFQEVPPATGSGLAVVITGRGAAFGDLFNDGHMDVVINSVDSTPTLLRNVVKNSNHWVTLKLVGGPKSPRDAIGAKAFVTAGGVRQRGDVISGGSYASSSDQRLHFGLGTATKVDKVEIHWPSGAKEQITLPEVDRIYTVVEGKGIVER